MKNIFKRSRTEKAKAAETVVPAACPAQDTFCEEVAAIAIALKMYQEEVHIHESTVITINRVTRIYSPWNSKIHGIPPMPNRKN